MTKKQRKLITLVFLLIANIKLLSAPSRQVLKNNIAAIIAELKEYNLGRSIQYKANSLHAITFEGYNSQSYLYKYKALGYFLEAQNISIKQNIDKKFDLLVFNHLGLLFCFLTLNNQL